MLRWHGCDLSAACSMAQAGAVSRVDADRDVDQIYKLLVIGDSNVGKTTLLTRFCEDRFQSTFMSTVGEVLLRDKTYLLTLFTVLLLVDQVLIIRPRWLLWTMKE